MGWGHLSLLQRRVLRPFVKGKEIHDLGAGDLDLSKQLLKLGASRVHAYDKDFPDRNYTAQAPLGMSIAQARFEELKGPFPIIFLSWPQNCPNAALTIHASLCEEMLIYQGSNHGGSCCGHPNLFKVMVQRELLAYIPDQKNDLIVTGRFLPEGQERMPTVEELHGLQMYNSTAPELSKLWTMQKVIDDIKK